MNNLEYLGSAEKWPTELNSVGQVMLTSEFDLIQQSIIRILSCPYGTEFFNEESGSRMEQVPYEQNDDVLQAMLDTVIGEAIERNEGRARYVRTEFSYDIEDDSKIFCEIYVEVLSRKKVQSFIWPYYKNAS